MTSMISIILLGGGLAVAAGLGTILQTAARSAALRREWDHNERMRVLDMGVVPPRQESRWPVALICSSLGLGVPSVAFVFTWMASQQIGMPPDIWVAPGVISVVSVISTSILAGVLLGSRPGSESQVSQHATTMANGKLSVPDPDAFDVVGTRGQ